MPAKPKREPVEPSNIITCVECKLDFDCQKSTEPFKTHLREKHSITELKGQRKTLMHMDGDNWFSWSYEWTIGGKTFLQNTTQPRCREDQMYWDAAGAE